VLIQRYGPALGTDSEEDPQVDWPGGLTAPQQALLMQCMQSHTFAPGQALLRAGDQGDVMWLIVQGTCSVLLSSTSGVERRIAGMRAGTVIGEIGFLDGAPRTATVMAETPVLALRLDRPTFDRLAEAEPDIVQRILERLALDLASRLRNSARYATAQIDTVLA